MASPQIPDWRLGEGQVLVTGAFCADLRTPKGTGTVKRKILLSYHID
jgi:hypothetical protein